MANKGAPPVSSTRRSPTWLVLVLWGLLAIVFGLLVTLSVFLLLKSKILVSGHQLTDEETKSLWAFIGVGLGALVTLIAALLTEQRNRWADIRAAEAAIKADQVAAEAEARQAVETLQGALGLLPTNVPCGLQARAAGAIATLIRLHGGEVAVRILGQLWSADAVDSDTAVWLIDRVLEDAESKKDAVDQAVDVLAVNADRLVPPKQARSEDQDWYAWPQVLRNEWPSTLSSISQYSAIPIAAVRMLLSREIDWWAKTQITAPIEALVMALDNEKVRGYAALALQRLIAAGAFAIGRITFDIDPYKDKINKHVASATAKPWYQDLLDQLQPWVSGQAAKLASIPEPALSGVS